MSRPNFVYRYTSARDIDRLCTLFCRSELYFARASQLNDPFEFKPQRMSTDTNGLAPSLVQKYIEPALDKLHECLCAELDNYGVCCFSPVPDSILMWSQYADSHTGMCLEFETSNEFFSTLQPVTYGERHDIDLKNWTDSDLVFKVMLRKHLDWKNESEWRLVRRPGGALVSFPPEILRSVIFGAKCLPDMRQTIKSFLSDRSVDFREARLDKSEYKLNLS